MRVRTIAIAGLAAAAAVYLFDPVAGSARRTRIREQIRVFTRRLAMPERTPPLPVNTVSTPAMEAVPDATQEATKAEVADVPREPMKAEVADTSREPMKAEVADTPREPMKAEVADTPREPMKAEVADTSREPMEEQVAVTHGDRPDSDDAIAARIRMKMEGRSDLETGSLMIDVVRGVAFLRGELKDRREIEEIVDLTGAVPGVHEVRNLIHLPESSTISRPAAQPLGDAWNG